MTPLDGALWLVRHGFAVFPADHPGTPACTGLHKACDGSRGKHPCVPFTRTHTTDEQQANRWFGEQLRNVAVAVGACHGPDNTRLLVVDSDRPGAIEDTATELGHQHTPTMRVHTAKGTHDYYWAPADSGLGNSLGQLRGKFDGDVRSGNGYVIGPGSVHATGVMYELADPEQPPVPLPGWLLAALQPPAGTTAPRPRARDRQNHGRALEGLIRTVLTARQGNRNAALYWAARRACEHAQKGTVDLRAIAGALVDAATHTGLTEAEARTTITSAYRRAGAVQ